MNAVLAQSEDPGAIGSRNGPEGVKGQEGRFFAIDRRVWRILCGRENADEMATYLTIACGTDSTNLMSRWSAHAVQTYTGLHSSRASLVIASLIRDGFLATTARSSPQRPLYMIQPFKHVRCRALEIAESERLICPTTVQRIEYGDHPAFDPLQLHRLLYKGILWQTDRGPRLIPETASRSQRIWLPNSLIVAGVSDSLSPVAQLRKRRSHLALRLLIDLYHAQNLNADGGVSRGVYARRLRRRLIAEVPDFLIFAFDSGDYATEIGESNESALQPLLHRTYGDSRQAYFDLVLTQLNNLCDLRLLGVVTQLVGGPGPNTEPVHALDFEGGEAAEDEQLERAIGLSAASAAERLLGTDVIRRFSKDRGAYFVPVWNTLGDVQAVRSIRLTHKPATRLTGEWRQRLRREADEFISMFDQLHRS